MHPLKKERLLNGFSLRQLSQRSGLSIPTIQRAESGEHVSELTAFKLAGALGAEGECFVRMLAGESGAAEESPEQAKQPA